MAKKDPPELLTTAEVAKLLRVSPQAVYHMIHKGQLPVHRLGRRLRFIKAEILREVEAAR